MQEYITESNHGVLDYLVVTSKEIWMTQPDDIRPVVKQSLAEAIAFGNKIAGDKAMSDKQAIIDSGRSKVLTLTDAERQQWVSAMKPVWKKFEDEIGKDTIDAAEQSNK